MINSNILSRTLIKLVIQFKDRQKVLIFLGCCINFLKIEGPLPPSPPLSTSPNGPALYVFIRTKLLKLLIWFSFSGCSTLGFNPKRRPGWRPNRGGQCWRWKLRGYFYGRKATEKNNQSKVNIFLGNIDFYHSMYCENSNYFFWNVLGK